MDRRARVGWAAAALALAGCNQVFGLDPGSSGDALDGAVVDGAFDAPVSFGPWGNAAAVLDDPMLNEDDAILTADGTELIYAASSAVAPMKDLMLAGRGAGTSWTTGIPLTELNSMVTDSTPRYGKSDTSIYFATDRPMTQGLSDIWRAERDAVAAPWHPPVAVSELSSPADDRTPSPCLGDTRFVLLSLRNGPIQLIEVVPGQSSQIIDVGTLTPVSPFVTADCLTLYFAGLVMGGTEYDLYVMERPALDVAWAAPRRIDELATAANETDPWLSADGRHLLFSRDTAATGSGIWEAFREPR